MAIFTGFTGRINRAKWWLGSLILLVVFLIIYGVLANVFALSPPTDATQVDALTRAFAFMQIIIVAIIGYPMTAMWIKRLNDRVRPRYFAYAFWVPTALLILGNVFGLTMTMTDTRGPMLSGLGFVLHLACLAAVIWAVVELGICKGTDGPNQHGPDPLAKQ